MNLKLHIEKILKGWISIVDPLPLTTIPAFAQHSSIEILDNLISLPFAATTAELDAVVMGKLYETEISRKAIALLSLTPNSTLSTAKDETGASGYILEEQNPDSTRAIAYYLPNPQSNKAVNLTIVKPGEVRGIDQIAIKSGGECEVSSNLIGKTIKLRAPVVYPEVVLISQKRIKKLAAHLVVLWDDNSVKYIQLIGDQVIDAKPNLNSGLRWIKLNFELSKTQVEDIIETA